MERKHFKQETIRERNGAEMEYIDMHVHSTFSDGTCTPEELVQIAQEKNLKAFVLTDHDTVAGVEQTIKAAEGSGVLVLPGIEVSAVYQSKDIHILGYDVDIHNEEFLEQLDHYQKERENRNDRMIQLLAEHGFSISKEKIEERFPGAVMTRAHFARYLCDEGQVSTVREAFEKYIGVGCPCYLPKKEIIPEEAMRCIQIAGGHPVLAHPMLYHMERREIEVLVRYLISLGLEGIEAIYSNNSKEEEQYLRQLAKKFGLYITGGSDFHGSNKPAIQMGTGKNNIRVPAELLKNIWKN